MTTFPLTTSRPCEAHRVHHPRPLTNELHHVVPVAWQLDWTPTVEPAPGADQAGRGRMWDNRTAVLCPTSHRNVHVWINRLVDATTTDNPLDSKRAVAVVHRGTRSREFAAAYLALLRWWEVGGSILFLAQR